MAESFAEVKPQARETTAGSMHSVLLLVIFYLFAIIWGVRNVYHTESSIIDLVMPFANAICLGAWAIIDARRRGHPIALLAQPWFVLLAGVLVPGYVIWSRGWRGLGWLLFHAFLWFIVATMSLHIGGWMVFGDEWLQALGLQ